MKKIIFLFFCLILIGCTDKQRCVWELKTAAEPLNAYLELHFQNDNNGYVKSNVELYDNYDFKMTNNTIYFFDDTFLVKKVSEKKIIIRNDHYWGEFSNSYYLDSDNKSIDSLFELHNVLYQIKEFGSNSIFMEEYNNVLSDILNGKYFNRVELQFDESID